MALREAAEGPNGKEGETPGGNDDAMAQKSGQLELPLEDRGEALGAKRSEQAWSSTPGNERPGTGSIMQKVVERRNMMRALKRVRQNGGSPGIDGKTVGELPEWLMEYWEETREQLLAGTYQPKPVRQVTIPKPGGGRRELGIPTVLDRLIQQALLQVLQPRFDPTFSEHSHGFRPGRGAHDAIREARQYVQGGKTWVADVDVEKFFDRVNHDMLMGRLAKRIEDPLVLRLIRRYLDAGVMANGVVVERVKGTPQGGPLSPLLANVLLDDIDQELERRGHAFVRYADDLRVFVGSRKAGERVMSSLIGLFGKLRLRVNESKSAVAWAWRRSLLGFSFWWGRDRRLHVRVAREALVAMKRRIRQITRRMRGQSLEEVVQELRTYLVGWKNYFKLADTPKVFRTLDQWIRHRLRAYKLKQWKRGRTAFRELRALGASEVLAATIATNTRQWWRNSAMRLHIVMPNSYFNQLGVPRLAP